MKILIIEDEYNLADAVCSMLNKQKYITDIATNGEDGLTLALTGLYDLIILDVMLPKKDGFEILKELREEKINSKIIMLTAKNKIEDKMFGFNNGVNDYLTKPFHMDELLARVNLQLRNENVNNDILKIGDIKFDIKKMKITNNQNYSIDVIGKEFQLLEMFFTNANQILSKEQIFNKIWGYDSECDINSLEAYISFIRKKLKLLDSKIKIKAVRGIGYRLEVHSEEIKD